MLFNGFKMVERLWRSVKYEEVYLKDYQGMQDAQAGLGEYFPFYNLERSHQSLGYGRPYEVYTGVPTTSGNGVLAAPNAILNIGSILSY